jgi:hypothetical protein
VSERFEKGMYTTAFTFAANFEALHYERTEKSRQGKNE